MDHDNDDICQVYDYEGAGVGMAMYNTDEVSGV